MGNPFEGLANFYEESVKENDAKGFANKYKDAAEYLFKCMKKEGYTPIKKEYLDGYYLFGYGTNSVVHFHVKETPGWKYGIWWNEPEKDTEGNYKKLFTGKLFIQYEENIDKFKPSYSSFNCTVSHCIGDKFNKNTSSLDWDFGRMLNYIKTEPELAFCRDYCGWDEYEYHTRAEAKKEFNDWKKRNELEKKLREEYRVKYYNFYKNRIIPFFGRGAKIVDKGTNWSPRYDLICKYPNKFFSVEKPGCYGLFDPEIDKDFFDNEDIYNEWRETEKDLDKLNKEIEKVSDKYNMYIWSHDYFYPDVCMYGPKKEEE